MNAFERRRRELADLRLIERDEKRKAKLREAERRATERLERRRAKEAAAAERAAAKAARIRPQLPVPQAELELLERAAMGDTSQSRSVRYLLFLLPGVKDPGGVKGRGLLETRRCERPVAEAFLKVLDWWWRLPPKKKSGEELYLALERIKGGSARPGGQPLRSGKVAEAVSAPVSEKAAAPAPVGGGGLGGGGAAAKQPAAA